MVEGLKELGLNANRPPATFYLWVPVPEGVNSTDFAAHLLRKAGIVVTPGNGFGASGEGFFRIALTVNKDRLAEALKRIKEIGIRP